MLLVLASAACAPREAPAPVTPPPAEPRPPERRAPLVGLRLGVLVPSGSDLLQQYAEAIVAGVEVAAAELERDSVYAVEVVVRRAADAAGTAAAVRELAAAGVAAIIGPLLDEDMARAAAARPDPTLPLISPTATGSYAALPQVYALNVPDTLGAAALGAHAAQRAYGRVAVLRPERGAGRDQARAFSQAYTRAAGRAPLEVSYDAGTTTFAGPLRRLRDARVDAFFLAGEERDVRQVLPQVRYYGLSGTQVMATGGWATPDGLERIGLATLDGVIVTLPFLQADSAGGWQQFVRAYEAHERRSLQSAIPALGYDAARLALAGRGGRGLTAAQVASRLAAGSAIDGATGALLPRPGGVLRQPILVRVRDGRLIPIAAVER